MKAKGTPAHKPAHNDEQLMNELKAVFEKLPNEIPIYLFTEQGVDNVFADANRQAARIFGQLSSRIVFREHHLDHELAKKWGVDSAPTLLVAPERYNIRWQGAPVGEEGRTFLDLLLSVGQGSTRISGQSRKVLDKIDSRRDVKVFVSPTCPYCPQQAVNALRAAIEKPEYVSLDIIDIQCRPEIAEKYSAFSVPQTYANEVLIGAGAQSEEVFMLSLLKMEPQTIFIPESDAELVEADMVIIGGGPAGLTAGIYAVRSGLKTVIIERDALGGQVATTPVVENYPGFSQVGGKSLVDIMVSHALEYVQIFQGEEVMDIKQGPVLEVLTSRRKYRAKSVLIATGAIHRHLDVPGESRYAGRGVSYCATCDGPLFRGKKAVIVGGGNSAVTEALYLHHMGVDVTLVHRRDALRAQEYLAKSLKESGIPVLMNTVVEEIRGDEVTREVVLLNNQTNKKKTLAVDAVFIAIGYSPAVALAQKIGIELTPAGFIKRDDRHRTNIAGIYSAGDVEGGYKQIVTAAGQGAEAAIAIFEDLINPYWTGAEKAV